MWQHKAQVALYQWAAEQIYGEPIYNICIDILRRASPGGRFTPEFRRLTTQRTSWQCKEAVEDLRYVAERISSLENTRGEKLWPANRGECKWCPYTLIHGESGRDEEIIKHRFEAAKEYLKDPKDISK